MLPTVRSLLLGASLLHVFVWVDCDSLWTPFLEHRVGIPADLATRTEPADGSADLSKSNPLLLSFSAMAFAAGTSLQSVAVADFNLDGKLDLAVVADPVGSDAVNVLLGDGAGRFGGPSNFAVGATPRYVVAGDWNSDGRPDVAVANYGSTSVSVLLGNGTGGLGTMSAIGVESLPVSIATGDFNGDGKLDLAVANLNASSVSVALWAGAGFGAATHIKVQTRPYSVAVGDFNRDSKLDLALANSDSMDVSVLLGNGTGSFSTPTKFALGGAQGPRAISVGEFSGDGIPDLAVVNTGTSNVSVLLGNGMGGFGAATNFGVGMSPVAAALGDFNLDGKTDLVAVNQDSNNVSVLPGSGSGGFGVITNILVGFSPRSVAVGDFNKDGKPDLAVANANSNDVTILLNTSK